MDFSTESARRPRMPVLFVGHGNPMNAIEDSEFSRAWAEAGQALPRPEAILCISAHWETEGTRVTATKQPETIHDFGGFPRALYEMQYHAPGSPELAQRIQKTVLSAPVRLDHTWGLDHGTWSVLCRMFPQADIPVVQLSLERTQPASFHYALGAELRPLRDQGILIVGSGNVVHNLGLITWQNKAYDWAIEFDDAVRRLILSGDHDPLIHYDSLGHSARLAVPTAEHYLPLLYILGLQEKEEPLRFFVEGLTMGSLSMRSLWVG
jgi:4,5-DOPA dioxygenase extradiol